MRNIILNDKVLNEAGIILREAINIHPEDTITNGFLQSNNPDYRLTNNLRMIIKQQQAINKKYIYISDLIPIIQNPAYQTQETMQFIFKNLRILVKDGSIPSEDMPKLINLLTIASKIPSGSKFADDFLAFLQNEKGNKEQQEKGKGSKQSRYGVKNVLDTQKKELINNLLNESIRKMLDTNEPDTEFNKTQIIRLATSLQPSETAITNALRNGEENVFKKAFDPALLMLWAVLIGSIDMMNMAGKYGGYRLPPTYKTHIVNYINNVITKYRLIYTPIIKYLIDKNIMTANRFRNIEYAINKSDIVPDILKNVKREYEESKQYELNTKAMRLYEAKYNPWAICHSTVDSKKNPEKFEKCVMNVKEKGGIKKEDTTVKNYELIVKNDKGKKKFKTTATSEYIAKEKVMKAEKCPLSAIISVKEINNINESNNKNKILNAYHYFIKEKVLQYMFKIKSDNNDTRILNDVNKIKNIILHAKYDIDIITPLCLSNNSIINEIPGITIIRHANKLDEVNYSITNPQDANGQNIEQQLDTIKSKGYNPATDNITVNKSAMENASKVYTKAQIKEMKFNNLCATSKSFTKKDLMKKNLKEWHGDEFYEKEPEKHGFSPENYTNVEDLYFTLKNGDTEDIYIYYPANIINILINNGFIYKDKRYYNWKFTNEGLKTFTDTKTLQKYLLNRLK
jgi:hypothetical protein